MMRRHRNPVHGRDVQRVSAIAAVSGMLMATADVRPTGSTPIDVLLVGVAAAAVTWAAATAPWWLVAVVALLAATIASSPVWALLGLVGVVLACWVGAGRHNMPWARSLAAMAALQALARGQLHWFFGASALLSCAAAATLFAWGVHRRPSAVRRTVKQVAFATGGVAAVLLLGFAIAALEARGSLAEGNRQARAGLAALNRGEMAAASELFRSAADSFARADDALSAPWAQGARLVPVAAQHRASVSGLAADAATAMHQAATALARVDPDTLRVANGRIDLDAVRALEQPFEQIDAAITLLQRGVEEAESPWLAGPLQRRIHDLAVELADNEVRAGNALLAVRLAPQMLGADRPRRYFVAFTTPAEARGLGGFMGNWAELTIDEGHIEMTDFGRHTDLDQAAAGNDPVLENLDEFVSHWGGFGFAGEAGGAADDKVWSIVTMAPDFPTVARVISQLYPQSGGRHLDGVFMLDPQAVATLLGFTGPIQVEGVDSPLTEQNAADFIISEQYDITANDERIDLLDAIARATVDKLLSTTLPPPAELAEKFAPLAAEGRWSAWSADASEQELFTRVKIDGAFPATAGPHGVAVTVDNASGSKIDAYLLTEVEYTAGATDPDGTTHAIVTVRLTNTAPSSGRPDYVIGNAVGLPRGTNRTWLSIYTASPMVGAQIDGRAAGMQTDEVFGWNVASRFLDIPPGRTITVVLTLEGTVGDAAEGAVVTRVQPLAITPVYQVR